MGTDDSVSVSNVIDRASTEIYVLSVGTFWRLAQGIYWKLVLFDVF